MIMGTLDTAGHIQLEVWDGTSWGRYHHFTSTSKHDKKCFDIAYENLSGKALVVGRHDDIPLDKRFNLYNIWNGTAWVFAMPQEAAELTTANNMLYVKMASKPGSDEILIAMVLEDWDLKIVRWDGTGFTNLGLIELDLHWGDFALVDIAYEQASGDALIVWARWDEQYIHYAVWNGATLSPVAAASQMLGGYIRGIRAVASPTSDHILVATADEKYDLNVSVWDGNGFTEFRELHKSIYDYRADVVDIAWSTFGEDVLVAWSPFTIKKIKYFTWSIGTPLSAPSVQNGPLFPDNIYGVRLLPVPDSRRMILMADTYGGHIGYSLWTGNAFSGDPAVVMATGIMGRSAFDIAGFK